jgi:Fe2+ or Zn2+ uptake regulation protein
MIEIALKRKGIAGENYKKAVVYCKVISNIYHSKFPREGATRKEIYTILRKQYKNISVDEISRFLQYLKDNKLILNFDNEHWVVII